MNNKGAKIAIVIFMLFAIVAFAFGTVMAMPMLNEPTTGSTQEQAGQALAVILLIAPFLLSYLLFALFDLVGFFIAIHLIKNDSKGLGIFNLLLTLAMFVVALMISLKILAF